MIRDTFSSFLSLIFQKEGTMLGWRAIDGNGLIISATFYRMDERSKLFELRVVTGRPKFFVVSTRRQEKKKK